MRAFSYSNYGSPEVLEQIEMPAPAPKSGEVLVRVYATSVSAGDWRARSLTMPKGLGFMGRLVFGIKGPRKPVLGTEFSGVIEAVGERVSNWQIGDAVVGFPGASFGAHAEFITMPADGKLVKKPEAVNFADAAVLPFGGTTAYDFLVNKARLKTGETVLINGASGSVGSACVQIAKQRGANVTAVCSGRNAELVRSLGADRVIDYHTQDVIEHGIRYDMIVDCVGTLPWGQAQAGLPPGGRMVLIAGKTSDMLFGALKAALKGKKMIGGVAHESRDVLETVVALCAQGKFKPVIDRIYPFAEMKAAHAHVDSGRKRGNVVVTFIPEIRDANAA